MVVPFELTSLQRVVQEDPAEAAVALEEVAEEDMVEVVGVVEDLVVAISPEEVVMVVNQMDSRARIISLISNILNIDPSDKCCDIRQTDRLLTFMSLA